MKNTTTDKNKGFKINWERLQRIKRSQLGTQKKIV